MTSSKKKSSFRGQITGGIFMRICVFTSAQLPVNPEVISQAMLLGRLLAEDNHTLIFGGVVTGLMGIIANTMRCVDVDTEIIGINHEKYVDFRFAGCSEHLVATTVYERMELYARNSDGYIVMDGGFGTVSEFMYVFMQKLCGDHDKPMVISCQDNLFNPEQLFNLELILPPAWGMYQEMLKYGSSIQTALNYLVQQHVKREFRTEGKERG